MNIPFIAGGAIVAGALVEGLVLYLIINMLQELGVVGSNYRGEKIPSSVGITFPLAVMPVFLIYVLFSCYDNSYHLFILGIMSISFIGFIDDILGGRDTLGFRGHFGALFSGRLTTGGLKALGGGLIAFFLAVFISDGWGNIILNSLIIALFTNMLNLLDLRPGRAVKGYLIFLIIILILAVGKVDWLLLAPLLGVLISYSPIDLRARAMMGDAGSNVLGLSLGYISVLTLPLVSRLAVLIFLIAMHIYTEKYSLSETIEKVAFLRAVDNWGRK